MIQSIARSASNLPRKKGLYFGAILVTLVVFLEIPWSPPNHKVESDVSVYGYGGQEILRGGLPYKDFWDLKPPGIYYLYAGAFWLMGSDAWSVWYVTVVWTGLLLTGMYFLLKAMIGTSSALPGTLIFLGVILQPGYFQGAGNPEFFGELASIGALFFSFEYFRSPSKVKLAALGAMLGANGLLKPTSVGTAAICVLVILAYEGLQHGVRGAAKALVYLAAPPVMGLALVVGFWSWNGALADLWQATVKYNFALFRPGFTLRGVYGVLRRFATEPPFVIPFGLSAGTGIFLWRTRRKYVPPKPTHPDPEINGFQPHWWTYAICITSLPVEMLLISSTGRDYGHYYQTAFPAMCVAASFWLSSRKGELRKAPQSMARTSAFSSLVVGCLAVWALAIVGLLRPSLSDLQRFRLAAPSRQPVHTDIGSFILANTSPDDTVLVWSISPELNFETGRRSPTRYIYDHVLLLPGFQNASRWHEFLAGLRKNPPALIIADTRHEFAPDLSVPDDQLAQACGCSGAILDGFRSFSRFVKTHYTATRTFAEHLVVYEKQAQ
ncbi:MAG: glycosyltransferase family 39 protein [Anaerolineales bacterium]